MNGEGRLVGVPHEEEKILLMFSGGIDSTYLLYDYLRNTSHPVHAHHVSIRYPRHQRWRVEDSASERIVAWCKENLRRFVYSTSRFDLSLPVVGWDSDLQLLVASKIALNLGPQRITLALGWCVEDLQRPAVKDRQHRNVTRNLWGALRQSAIGANLNEDIAMPIIERGMTKAEVIAELPDELVDLSWSCRSPMQVKHEPRPCGRCHACVQRIVAKRRATEL